MIFHFDYATPSAYDSNRDRAMVGLSVDARRPVRFHGRVVDNAFLVRVALRAMGEVIWSDDTWGGGGILDPIITVHPDRIFFEAFSGDQSAYVQVTLDPGLFATEGEVIHGTANVDFTRWLWATLAEMRSSRETWFRIGAEGFEVATAGAGGRFQPVVDVPDAWLRGFLALQEAMAFPGTRFQARPVDLLAAIRFLRYAKAKVSPRAIRYEFVPGEEPRLILEPWEEAFPFRGAEHHYAEPRTIRVWGRRKLRLLEPLLPFADSVGIYLKGRALPSFYVVTLPGIEFLLGLSGWTARRWSEPGGHALLGGSKRPAAETVNRARKILVGERTVKVDRLAKALECPVPEAAASLGHLCREGSALFDLQRREYRHRELFAETPDIERLFPPDLRGERAEALLGGDKVEVATCQVEETRKNRRFKTPDGPVFREIVYRDWKIRGRVEDLEVEVTVSDQGKIIFGTCPCDFFRENLLNQGPCEHLLALFEASAGQRVDLPTSRPSEYQGARPPAGRPPEQEDDEDPEEEEGEGEENEAFE